TGFQLKLEQVELGDRRFRYAERLTGAEYEPVGTHCGQQLLKMILGRPPDPGSIPPDATGLVRGTAEMHLFYETALRVRHQQAGTPVQPDQGADGGGAELRRGIRRMPLAAVFQPHREHDRTSCRGTGKNQLDHEGTGRPQPVLTRVYPNRRGSVPHCLLQRGFPAWNARVDRGNRPQTGEPQSG